MALIIDRTIGESKTTAVLTLDDFREAANVSREWIVNAVDTLDRAKLITRGREVRPGAVEYAIKEHYVEEVRKAGRQKLRGRCPHCQAVGEFDTRFVPTPHLAMRRLGACVPSAVYRVTLAVAAYTLTWNPQARAIEVKPSELVKPDLERMTGLESREITTGLTQAVKLGLVGRLLRKGRPSIFWVNPEAIAGLEPRPPRKVKQPTRKPAQKATEPTPPKPEEKPTKTVRNTAKESKPGYYGRCLACGHFVEVEPVTEAEFAALKPPRAAETPPRVSAGRERPAKKSMWEKTKQAAWEMFVAK